MAERLQMLDERLRPYDQRIERLCRQDERCRRLVKVEGVGPLVATALVAAIRGRIYGRNRYHVITVNTPLLRGWVHIRKFRLASEVRTKDTRRHWGIATPMPAAVLTHVVREAERMGLEGL